MDRLLSYNRHPVQADHSASEVDITSNQCDIAACDIAADIATGESPLLLQQNIVVLRQLENMLQDFTWIYFYNFKI